MTHRLLALVAVYAACSVGLGAVFDLYHPRVAEHFGLNRTVLTQGSGRSSGIPSLARAVDLDFLEDDPDLPRRNFSVRWEGWWYFPGDAVVDVDAGVDDRVLVSIDGKPVFERDISRGLRSGRRRLSLDQGFHDIRVDYAQYGGEGARNLVGN